MRGQETGLIPTPCTRHRAGHAVWSKTPPHPTRPTLHPIHNQVRPAKPDLLFCISCCKKEWPQLLVRQLLFCAKQVEDMAPRDEPRGGAGR
eukprot:361209-Chlamydomonas_euryale.AAC.3